jgi:hypothetical protein
LVIAFDPEFMQVTLVVMLNRIQGSDSQLYRSLNGRELTFRADTGKQFPAVVHHHRLLNAVNLEKLPQKTLQHACST